MEYMRITRLFLGIDDEKEKAFLEDLYKTNGWRLITIVNELVGYYYYFSREKDWHKS